MADEPYYGHLCCPDAPWNDTCPGCNPHLRPVSIPLPPEPPRDRVVEAVDQNGTVVWRLAWGRGGLCWMPIGMTWGWSWNYLAYSAMRNRWTLRHVAAESGEQT